MNKNELKVGDRVKWKKNNAICTGHITHDDDEYWWVKNEKTFTEYAIEKTEAKAA